MCSVIQGSKAGKKGMDLLKRNSGGYRVFMR